MYNNINCTPIQDSILFSSLFFGMFVANVGVCVCVHSTWTNANENFNNNSENTLCSLQRDTWNWKICLSLQNSVAFETIRYCLYADKHTFRHFKCIIYSIHCTRSKSIVCVFFLVYKSMISKNLHLTLLVQWSWWVRMPWTLLSSATSQLNHNHYIVVASEIKPLNYEYA